MDKAQDIKRLEEITQSLNAPETDIDDAISLFEEGVKIVKANYEEIKKASGKITELKKELDSYAEIKFDAE